MKKIICILALTLNLPFLAIGAEFKVHSEFLQLLDFESSVLIYSDEETDQLRSLIEKLLSEKTECSLNDINYYYRHPNFEDVEMYYSGLFPKFQFNMYGDVWQFEVLEATVDCAKTIEDFKMTHFIEDGVRLKASQGMFKTEDYWMEVRVSFLNTITNEYNVHALYLSESNTKAGIGPIYVDRDSVEFDWEMIKP